MNYDDFKIGYSDMTTTTITEEKNKKFAEIIGDFNPVHFNESRMKSSPFGRCVTNGFLTASTIGTTLVKMFTSNETLVIALKQENKFLAPVFIGDTLTTKVTVSKRIPDKQRLVCECVVENQNGVKVAESEFLVKILPI